MKVQDVALVQGDEIDQLEYEGLGHEVASDVEQNATPRKSRRVDDHQLRDSNGSGRARATKRRVGQQLAQRLQRVEGTFRSWRGDDDTFLGRRDSIGRVKDDVMRVAPCEFGDVTEVERNGRVVSGRARDESYVQSSAGSEDALKPRRLSHELPRVGDDESVCEQASGVRRSEGHVE